MSASLHVETPIPIQSLQGEFHSWFVPVSVGDSLVGFFQLLPDLSVMRYSSFQRRSDSLDGCPSKATWIDVDAIQRHALLHAPHGAKAGDPFLTYDGVPSRLAWAIPFRSVDGAARTLLVAGQSVWEASGET